MGHWSTYKRRATAPQATILLLAEGDTGPATVELQPPAVYLDSNFRTIAAGQLLYASVLCGRAQGYPMDVKAEIWSDARGSPNALLTESPPLNFNPLAIGATWLSFQFQPLKLLADWPYHLILHAPDNAPGNTILASVYDSGPAWNINVSPPTPAWSLLLATHSIPRFLIGLKP